MARALYHQFKHVDTKRSKTAPIAQQGKAHMTKGISRKRFMELITLIVGREKGDYSPYSLRIGGAVHLHNLGATELTIRSMGRWSTQSSTYALYIKAAFSRGNVGTDRRLNFLSKLD